MRKGIAVAGNILLDRIKVVDSYPEKGLLVKIRELENAIGGCVCNTGTDLCVIDPSLRVSGYGKVGRDGEGAFLKKKLTAVGMDVSHIGECDVPTTFSDVMTVAATGERTFFTFTGADATLGIADIDPAALDCEIFHIGYILLLDALDAPDEEYGTVMARLLAGIQRAGVKTSVDVISEDSERFREKVIPALKYCDYAVLNEIESGRVAGIPPRDGEGRLIPENMEKICEAFFEMGVRECVVVHCPEAGFARNARGEFFAVPSLDLPKDYIKGAVGAGDAFCAGALYSFWRGDGEEEMLRFASACAACNLSAKDSVSGMRSYEEIKGLESRFGRKSL